MSFLVHSPGTQSWLVDFGRPRWRSLGVPVGGAADRTSLALGNALLGNAPDVAALEFALAGPTLEATAEHGCVVLGAPFQVHLDERPQPIGTTFTIRPGQVLTISTTASGLRGYLCVVGGFESREILGSRSALEPVKAGHELVCSPSRIRRRFWKPDDVPAREPNLLHVLEGTHASNFAKDQWVSQEYAVGPDSNRMGLRLESQPLEPPNAELLSAPVCPGTIQVTNDGQTIVLGVDAQTIGGYPRLAHVISADLDKLGQLTAGDKVRFEWVDLLTAQRRRREHETWLHDAVLRLQSSLV
jgi:antagonist of KipI